MANTIRIKRRSSGVGAGAPSGLANAELAYNEGDNILYYGFGTGGAGGTATQVIPIAGSGAYLNKNNNLSDLNNLQTSRNNLAGSVTSGSFMRGNGTNVLMGSILASDVPTLNQNTTGNAGTVTNGVYTGRTLTAGSGIAGGGDLSADRTFNIGQGDGITVSSDAIAVDSTVVRTTGDQSIAGAKTFTQQSTFNNGVLVGGINRFTTGGGAFEFSIDRGNINPGFAGDILKFDVDSDYGNGYSTTLKTSGPTQNIIIKLPDSSGVLARLEDITTTNITGVLAVNKGGTGRSSYSDGQLLIGSGTSLAANTLTAGTGISIANGSGTITINNSRTGSTSIVVSSLEYQRAALTGDVTASQNNNTTTIANDAVTNAKAANMAVNTIKGRITAGTGDPEDLTAANVRTIINVADGANNYAHPTDGGAGNTITAANLRVLSAITVNTLGHVTSVSSKDLTANDIPNISTDKLTSGTLGVGRGGIGATTLTQSNILVGNGTNAISAPYTVETTLTGGASAIPRADAVKTYVDNLLGANDAMVFKGTIGTGGTVTALPTTHQAGWAYRVITAATYAGKVCEIGDLLIAIVDRSGSSNTNDDWTAIQTNLDGAVIGPASATDNALAVYNGATGKLIKNSSFVPTTVGGNLINLTNPSAITFPKINADNTVSTESAATHRTSLGATTVGSNLFILTNPGAISFLRINADNSVSSLSNTDFRTAIGAGTSSTVGTVTTISAGGGMNYSPITSTGSVTLGTPSSITLSSTNSVTSTSHTHAFSPGGTTSQYIRGDGAATSGAALTKTDDTNVTLTIGGSPTNALLSATSLTLGWTGNLAVNRGGTGQTSYANGELLIGNTTNNTLTKATLTQGSNVTITNGNGSITIASTDTNTATAADGILAGSNTGTQITYASYATNQAASATPRFYNTNNDPSGSGRLNVSAYFYATRLFDNGSRVVTAATICSDAGDCTWNGGDF